MTIYLPIPVPNKIEYNINIPYSPTNGTMIVVPPATINAILFMRRQSAHGLSDINPTVNLDTVLAMPIIEISKACCPEVNPTSLA